MEKYSVGVVTGTRAEYGLLRPLLFKLRDNKKINLKLIVTGSHLSGKFGSTKDEIIKDGFDDFYAIPIPIDDDSKTGMAYATGEATKLFAEFFNEYNPIYRLFKIYLKNQDFEKAVWSFDDDRSFVDCVSSGLILSFITSPPVMHTSIIANISSYICA
mgnify:CR=1 FL=1